MHEILLGVTSVRFADVPSKLEFVFTHGSLDIENITYGFPLRRNDHLVLEIDYTVNREVFNLKTKRGPKIGESIKKKNMKL